MKHPIFRFIKQVAFILVHKYEIVGLENLPDGPAVVVGNHSHTYGPVVCELYYPKEHYTWCVSDMMEKEKVAAYAYKDFWSKKPMIVRPFFKLVSHMIPPLSEFIFTNADTIPVYHDKRIIKTFSLSSDKLKENANIVIFPEEYTEYNNIVHRFQRGFVHVAKYHFRQTNEALPFVPMYVCPSLNKLVFGTPIWYNPNAKSKEEEERICSYLQDAISEIAYKMPRHKVVPYPNVSKRKYPFNERQL